ncbi:MAG: ArsC family reductase [Gammaproteobacteria bacterium]|nr:ArsC family reductase [Gammaproteobacteria bacterium]MDP2140946.1 ArsC family reductase [Gammaproteobacteria bacterium]MDP2349310.1 ArsC family reductase [Gammaproteobacteria bacterium]
MKADMITLYGIANCDTIKKTRQWLTDQQIPYAFHDYKKQGIDAELAGQMLQALSLESLINKRGTTWRKLPTQMQANLSQETALTLMLAQPSVIRRPVLSNRHQWMAGYDEEKFRTLRKQDPII